MVAFEVVDIVKISFVDWDFRYCLMFVDKKKPEKEKGPDYEVENEETDETTFSITSTLSEGEDMYFIDAIFQMQELPISEAIMDMM